MQLVRKTPVWKSAGKTRVCYVIVFCLCTRVCYVILFSFLFVLYSLPKTSKYPFHFAIIVYYDCKNVWDSYTYMYENLRFHRSELSTAWTRWCESRTHSFFSEHTTHVRQKSIITGLVHLDRKVTYVQLYNFVLRTDFGVGHHFQWLSSVTVSGGSSLINFKLKIFMLWTNFYSTFLTIGWFFSRNTFDESLILDHRFLKTWTAYPKTLINIFFSPKEKWYRLVTLSSKVWLSLKVFQLKNQPYYI
jgi:hypothetical protein